MTPVVTEFEDAPTDGWPSSSAATLIQLASNATAPKRANTLLLRISLLRSFPKRSIIIPCCFYNANNGLLVWTSTKALQKEDDSLLCSEALGRRVFHNCRAIRPSITVSVSSGFQLNAD